MASPAAPSDSKAVPTNAPRNEGLMTTTLMDCIAATPSGTGRRANAQKPADLDSYFARVEKAPEFVGKSASLACPRCRYDMYEVKSQGIVIDLCLQCQSIWFDAGELKAALAAARRAVQADI